MLSLPITHNETLKAKLGLENTVHELRVLAAVGVVDLVVGAHERSNSGADGIGKWPRIQLMESAVVHVGGQGFADIKTVADRLWSLTEVLLFIGNEVL